MSDPTTLTRRPPPSVHLVVPDGIHDPARPSGGNVYDRELAAALRELGSEVDEVAVAGTWPRPTAGSDGALVRALAGVPDGATVLVDGLIGLGCPHALEDEQQRLRLWLLVHLPLTLDPLSVDGGAAPSTRADERRALLACRGVLATSDWTRRWLLASHALDPGRVHVAQPGVAPAGLVTGTEHGGHLLTVGAVAPAKGHDVLLAALTAIADLPWSARIAGPLDRAPSFVSRLRADAEDARLALRVRFDGPLAPAEMAAAYGAADLLVLPTRLESYGMVVTEALARGVPVVASHVGGIPESLGTTRDGRVPGVLVPTEDPTALSATLRRWLTDAPWRDQLRAAARRRRDELAAWSVTAGLVKGALFGDDDPGARRHRPLGEPPREVSA
ncbi:MAG: glycosyltransferase family 4 protein [Nocardioidaceae bacterium]|nr:glycosyltransferase family 4 protein [Nocardioidaceae bacterium]